MNITPRRRGEYSPRPPRPAPQPGSFPPTRDKSPHPALRHQGEPRGSRASRPRQLVTSLRSPGRGHARDMAGPRRTAAAWAAGRPDLELGDEAREEGAIAGGARWGPLRRLRAGCAPHLWTMAMRQKVQANRMDNSAVQAMLPSRRLLISRRRGECRCLERIECDNRLLTSRRRREYRCSERIECEQ